MFHDPYEYYQVLLLIFLYFLVLFLMSHGLGCYQFESLANL